ncbi:MAG: glycosyltransferase [Alphaproteobacteria bacterium]
MTILHIMAGRGNGGAETYAADMILALHEAGMKQIAVLHPAQRRAPDLLDAGVRVETAPLRLPLRFMQRRAVTKLCADVKPDLVHCWMRRAASLVPAGLSIPVVGWFGGYYEPRHFARCTHFIGVTPDIVAHMGARGIPESRRFFVPTFPTVDSSLAIDRKIFATPADARILLTLSRLHPKKGLEVLLAALAQLPDCHLWLAGDGPLRQELEALAAKLGIAGRVKFLGWREDRGALLRAADISVLPSIYEPFGTVMSEAWAAGAPLVAADAAGPAAFVRDGENGMLVPKGDAPALAAALRKVLDLPALRERICRGGRETYEAQFTRAAVTRRMMDVYREIG